MPGKAMECYAGMRRLFGVRFGGPNMDLIATCCQAVGDESGVVTHAAGLRWIFSGNEMPCVHQKSRFMLRFMLRRTLCAPVMAQIAAVFHEISGL
jgi:hypothetical protein